MPPAKGSRQYRGIGGEYKINVQADNEFDCCDNWLAAILTDADLVGDRVYPGWAPETATLIDEDTGDPLDFITYRFMSADPDMTTHGRGGSGGVISTMHYEVLVWKQGKTYKGISAKAASVRVLLDVADITTSDGYIAGAGRWKPARGYYGPETVAQP